MKTPMKFAAGLLVTTILAGPVSAQISTAFAAPASMAPASTTSTEALLGAIDGPFAGSALAGDDTLGAATAREDIAMLAQSETTSTISNNSVSGTSTTGEISFGDTAFQNSGGLTIVNANSGNNVGMNASINVNIVMTPPQQ